MPLKTDDARTHPTSGLDSSTGRAGVGLPKGPRDDVRARGISVARPTVTTSDPSLVAKNAELRNLVSSTIEGHMGCNGLRCSQERSGMIDNIYTAFLAGRSWGASQIDGVLDQVRKLGALGQILEGSSHMDISAAETFLASTDINSLKSDDKKNQDFWLDPASLVWEQRGSGVYKPYGWSDDKFAHKLVDMSVQGDNGAVHVGGPLPQYLDASQVRVARVEAYLNQYWKNGNPPISAKEFAPRLIEWCKSRNVDISLVLAQAGKESSWATAGKGAWNRTCNPMNFGNDDAGNTYTISGGGDIGDKILNGLDHYYQRVSRSYLNPGQAFTAENLVDVNHFRLISDHDNRTGTYQGQTVLCSDYCPAPEYLPELRGMVCKARSFLGITA